MPGNQASAVPQGDIRRRARPESEGDTDQPAATRRRVEKVRRLMWALDSRVEGRTLRGDYKSVYNARWHHVIEVPGGEGTGMEVHVGKPPQSWTYKAVGRTLEKDDGVEPSGAPRLRLMVLTSERAWDLLGRDASTDCYVNCEVDRVWQIVKGDLTEWFNSIPEDHFTPHPRLLTGTPGIGKSLAAGSYLLYQLLHYDAELLPVVVFFFCGSVAYVFNKTTETVTSYMNKSMMIKAVKELSLRGMKGYIIYEVGDRLDIPSPFLPPGGWGMLLVATPETTSYIHWANEKRAVRIIMNCPDESDVKAMCVWKKRNQPPPQQAEYWREVKGRMDKLGPILRYIFDEGRYEYWITNCHNLVDGTPSWGIQRYFVFGTSKLWEGNNVLEYLARIVRVRGERHGESPLNLPITAHLASKTLCMLAELMTQAEFNLFVSRIMDCLMHANFGKCAMFAFLNVAFMAATRRKLKELKSPTRRPSHRCAPEVHSQEGPTSHYFLPSVERIGKKTCINHRLLYIPEAENFPLVDGFFFMDSNPKTLVGLRMATAGGHHTTASTVRQFTECLAAYFNGWKKLSRDMSWEIIYVQHADSTPMNDWQRCDVVNSDNVSKKEGREIAAFWEEKVRQYQVSIPCRDF
ncbi:retrotransposon hot spot (RHS) protein [Trypanosoma cruzi cruzi]|uniref:Putative retrotransposon hot spot (RHS) protein n=1 Tax=Trypanosoma cruzi TaxID=5693 RepID=A0A2V2W353_TRYCR|nr:retrotransposon hot spot (RHS) protein [Trypanosoma cruzi cruzi]PWV01939.1 putative retrotransposon hot spot (RHS) protein [Trypanosoma cruzi]